jgi:hypothetical protein
MVLNVYRDGFTLPGTAGGSHWQLLIDTNLPKGAEIGRFATGEVYTLGKPVISGRWSSRSF